MPPGSSSQRLCCSFPHRPGPPGRRRTSDANGEADLDFDLTSGKDVTIAHASRTDSPPAIGPSGLVYALNPHYGGPAKLVFFMATASLLAMVS